MLNKVECIHSTGKGREVDFFLIVPVYYCEQESRSGVPELNFLGNPMGQRCQNIHLVPE